MGRYLNSNIPFESYKSMAAGKYFVDKSSLISELLPALNSSERFYCITRPRRFGKSVMANMVGAFFGKSADASGLFGHLEIAANEDFQAHLNRHNVMFIDFSEVPEKNFSYEAYIARISDGIKADLRQAYGNIGLNGDDVLWNSALWDILTAIFQKTGERFIFVIDEWDALFHLSFIQEAEKEEYLRFLKSLLKGKVYAELVYMTGILPIAKYSGGSELNMFLEYDMATSERFSGYFGFLESDVDKLYQVYRKTTKRLKITRSDLSLWYDGYHTAAGEHIYNPRSIVCALTDNQLRNYWTSSGPYDEIFYYIKGNVEEIQEDFALMVSGGRVESRMQGYAVMARELNTKDQIYSAMVVYGLLTYEEGEVFIPNKELMDQYNELLLSNENLGYVNRLAKASDRMLKATLSGDTETMAEILAFAHNTESPILSYNREIELSAIVNVVYLSARDKYRVEREDKGGKGFVDFIFYPERKNADGIILELKVDGTPEEAIEQIKERNYALRFKGKLGENPKYTGKVLLVGISYDEETKIHSCKVEWDGLL